MSQSDCRRWTIYRGADVVDSDGSRWEYPTVADPELAAGEEVVVIAAADVLRLLEDAYHPQNPSSIHPADLIRRQFDVK